MVNKVKIYGKYRPAPKGGTINECKDKDGKPIRAQQQFKTECDLNVIMKNAQATGMAPQTPGGPTGKEMSFGDYSNVPEYTVAKQTVIDADEAFMRIRSDIRKKFDNDPKKLIAFLDDPKNRSEAEELGIIPKKPKKEPEKAEKPEKPVAPEPEPKD